jgi:hypothetical protein|tara:strand:- start:1173 stop:1415 length:243 start_codon:yes stop_codon:yes gene_type:complete
MPTYPVINQVTGETKTLNLTMKNYDQWRKDNPDWDKDWSQGCAGVGEVGDWQNKLIKEKPGWNEVLDRASRMPGAAVTKI